MDGQAVSREGVGEEGSPLLSKRPEWPVNVPTVQHAESSLIQLFHNLRDPTMEGALYEIESMRHFAGLKLDRLPDETIILMFRHFLEPQA